MSPEKSTAIAKNYSKSALKSKLMNKTALQKQNKLNEGKEIFVAGVISPITEAQYGNELIECMKAALEIGVQIIICSDVEKKYQKILDMFQKDYPTLFTYLEFSEENQEKVLAAADSAIFLEESDQKLLEKALTFGVVPVSTPTKILEDFNAVEEKGNAFIIEKVQLWNIFEACIRARENFKFPYDWKNLQLSCMS